MDGFVRVVLVIAGVVHLAPVVGVTGRRSLARLYEVDVEDRDVLLLLRHRAVLLGVVGGVMVAGAFVHGLTTAALVVGLVSTASYLLLYRGDPDRNAALRRVLLVDVVLAVLLAVALLWRSTGS